jgi:hypothetical protein
MHKHVIRALILGAAFTLSGIGIASAETTATPAIVAQATPAPKDPATPNPLTYSGYVRAYDFTRLNNPQLTKSNPLNQESFSTAFDLHLNYNFVGGLGAGVTYLYSNSFNDHCTTAASHAAGPPCVKANTGAAFQGTNPDDTLPGFEMSTLYEAYLVYRDPSLFIKAGNQVINTPWANPSDSRLKPVAFQGGDIAYQLDKNWTGEFMYMDKFESRVDSDFLNSTLLTATKIADAPGAGSNLHIPNYSATTTNGFFYGRAGYKSGPLYAEASDYQFLDIANAVWVDGTYALSGALKPALAFQLGNENNTGRSVIGKINSQVFGIQGGITPWKDVSFTVGYDYIPRKQDTITLPAGVTCSATGTIGGTAVFPYFLPSGGTPQCHKNSDGTTNVYYGGWASPYTDSYATDPLFTTSISQGMADRRSPGQSVKVALTTFFWQHRIRFIASRAYYDYGTAVGGVAPTQESDLDGTLFLNPVGKGTYHGLSLRYRYAERNQNFFTTNPDFKYNRAQLEYDF